MLDLWEVGLSDQFQHYARILLHPLKNPPAYQKAAFSKDLPLCPGSHFPGEHAHHDAKEADRLPSRAVSSLLVSPHLLLAQWAARLVSMWEN